MPDQARAPMTCGQLSVMRSMGGLTGDHQRDANVLSVWAMPYGMSVPRVTDAWNRLVEAHESLRTTYGVTGDGPVQHVQPHAPAEPTVINRTSIDEDGALAVAREVSTEPLRPSAEPPVHPLVITEGAHPKFMVSVMHHICVDGIAREVLESQFLAALAGAPVLPERQPVALAAEQRAATGTRRRRIAFWEKVWDGIEEADLRGIDPAPRLMVTLYSRPAMEAAAAIARDHQVSTQAAVLAMTVVALAGLRRRDRITLALMAANRYDSRWMNAVTSMNQSTPVTLDLPPDRIWPEFLRHVFLSSLAAYQNGIFDVDDLKARLIARGHANPDPLFFDVIFNFLGDVSESHPEDSAAARAVDWGLSGRTTGPRLSIFAAVGEGLLLSARVSPGYLPGDTPGRLLASIEALLIGAARERPGHLRELGSGAPLRAYARPS